MAEEGALDFMIRRADLDRVDDLAFLPTRCAFWPTNPAATEDEMLESHIAAEAGIGLEDSAVWRVGVQAGYELTAAATIRRLCSSSTALLASGIRWANALAKFRGCIFVFALKDSDVPLDIILQRIAFVKLTPPPLRVDLRAQEPRVVDLSSRWGRIAGTFAMVIEVDEEMKMTVLVVPRLPSGEEARPPRKLHAPDEAVCSYEGYNFRHGLLVGTGVSWYDVSEEHVNPLPEEQDAFFSVRAFWPPSAPRMNKDDRVFILDGRLKFNAARVVSLDFENDVRLQLLNPGPGVPFAPFFVPKDDVVVEFSVQDYVEVVSGPFAGNVGYVQRVDWVGGLVEIAHRRTALFILQDRERNIVNDLKLHDSESQFRLFEVAVRHLRLIERAQHPSTPETTRKPTAYEGMEVVVLVGQFKGYFGRVVNTSADGLQTQIRVDGVAVGHPTIELQRGEVQERFTKLPLPVAKKLEPAIALALRRENERREQEESQSRPRPRTPDSPAHTDMDLAPEPQVQPRQVLRLGWQENWLIDRRLLRVRLDVKIQNTVASNYRQGKQEGRAADFARLQDRAEVPSIEKVPTVQVLLGKRHNMFRIQTSYIFPQTSTEREGEISAENAHSILSEPGASVVIIGPDVLGCEDYIGYVGEVLRRELQEWANVLLIRDSSRKDLVKPVADDKLRQQFPESSVCRTSSRTLY